MSHSYNDKPIDYDIRMRRYAKYILRLFGKKFIRTSECNHYQKIREYISTILIAIFGYTLYILCIFFESGMTMKNL